MFILLFFLHGLTSILAQVIILRELMTAFWGNELFLGASLGFWLLGAGLGSYFAHKIPRKKISLKDLLSLDLILLALGLPTEIILIRQFRGKFFLHGEIPNFFLGSILSFLTLLPFCATLDALFTLATQLWAKQKKKKETPKLISRAYFWETVGLAVGGVGFNFLLIKIVEFKVLFFLSALNLLFAAKIGKNRLLKWGAFMAFYVALLVSLSPLSSALNIQTLKFVYPALVTSVNSKYGKITVTRSRSQYNFFESGKLTGASQNLEKGEYLVHFVLNLHPNPQKILVVGGGFNGIIAEILKYKSIKQIDYVELDPLFLKVVKKYLPLKLQKSLAHPKVQIIYQDSRTFLKKAKERYDLILFNLPNPSTALLNRLYTKECLEETKKILEKEGILITNLDLPIAYLSEEAESLASCIYWTQKKVFPDVFVFPEETILFVSSHQPLEINEGLLKKRFQQRDIPTDFFSPKQFSYRINSDYINRLEQIFQEKKKVKINSDYFPIAYFYQIAFWQTKSSFLLAKVFQNLAKLHWQPVFLTLCLSFLLSLHWTKKSTSLAPLLVGTAGFTLMVFETLIIFTFQAKLGYLFAKISLIFTAFLSAMGGGNFWATKHLERAEQKLKIIIAFLIFCSLFTPFILKQAQSELPFYLLALLVGFLVGTVFPLANQIFLKKEKKAVLKTGILYSADLFGASSGAFLTSVFLIPILGVQSTIYLIAAINTFLFLFLIL